MRAGRKLFLPPRLLRTKSTAHLSAGEFLSSGDKSHTHAEWSERKSSELEEWRPTREAASEAMQIQFARQLECKIGPVARCQIRHRFASIQMRRKTHSAREETRKLTLLFFGIA